MNKSDLKRLIKLLGPNGTRAGLIDSKIETRSLRSLARRLGADPTPEEDRNELARLLVQKVEDESLLPLEQLMQMSFEELEDHFARTAPSTEDLMRLMKQLDYKVSSADKKHLRRFAARQISETALFSTVAGRNGR
jgi:hypothetical protein